MIFLYYIYILRCADNSLYTGITTDLNRRLSEHKEKTVKGAKYTHSRTVLGVAAAWQTDGRSEASRLEAFLKKLPKNKKESLVCSPENLVDFLGINLGELKYTVVKDW